MIVLDASVAVKLLTFEPGAEVALARIISEAERLAPDWIRIEVANALMRKVRRDGLPTNLAVEAISALPLYLTEEVSALRLLGATLPLASRLQHDVYDCLYLALAMQRGATLVTADAKFVRSVERAGLREHVELLA